MPGTMDRGYEDYQLEAAISKVMLITIVIVENEKVIMWVF